MKEITILSGKGGTGKTSITAALASVAENTVFCDNDVDAADLHLIFQPDTKENHEFSSGWNVVIDSYSCTDCGVCIQNCRFDAIHYNGNDLPEINPFQCEGCRLCERTCPEGAIRSKENNNNSWYVSDTRFGELVHARMGPGEENSGKLVTVIRKRAKEIAKGRHAEFILNDGPPGIGCAAISSLSGTNAVLLVIEPTKSGMHDVQRLVELAESFGVVMYSVINKHDINDEITGKVEAYLQEKNIPLLAKIPFDTNVVEAMIEGKTVVEYNPASEVSVKVREVWDYIKKDLL